MKESFMRNENTEPHTISLREEEANLQDLTQALNQLRLAQQRVESVRQRIEDRHRRIQNTETSSDQVTVGEVTPRNRRRKVHPLVSYVVGDYVRIKNPNSGQEDRGIVFGVTRSALVKLRANNGDEIRRLSKNLILLQSVDERERAERAARSRGTTTTTERQQ